MSTLTLPLNGLGYSGSTTKDENAFIARLIKAREAKAERVTLAYLASQTDERLAELGLSAARISAIRTSKT